MKKLKDWYATPCYGASLALLMHAHFCLARELFRNVIGRAVHALADFHLSTSDFIAPEHLFARSGHHMDDKNSTPRALWSPDAALSLLRMRMTSILLCIFPFA